MPLLEECFPEGKGCLWYQHNARALWHVQGKPLFQDIYLSASRTKSILISADTMPTETADLVATGAREEVDVINLQRLHAKGAFHRVFLSIRAARHLYMFAEQQKVYNNLIDKEGQHLKICKKKKKEAISIFDNLRFAPLNISILHHLPPPHTSYLQKQKLPANNLSLSAHSRATQVTWKMLLVTCLPTWIGKHFFDNLLACISSCMVTRKYLDCMMYA